HQLRKPYLLQIRSTALSPLFHFTTPPTTEIYTLSLHDALPISLAGVQVRGLLGQVVVDGAAAAHAVLRPRVGDGDPGPVLDRRLDRKSTRLNSSHVAISYAVFCLKKKKYKLDASVPVYNILEQI